MHFNINGFSFEIKFHIRTQDTEFAADMVETSNASYEFDGNGVLLRFSLDDDYRYTLDLKSSVPASAKAILRLLGEEELYHVIPCNIHGDNNLKNARPGFFPNLTYEFPESESTSPEWEFRADRASHPVSMIACKNGAIGISVDPYSEDYSREDGFIRNGVFSRLPDTAGVSLGYRNYPYTFTFKEMMTEPTGHYTLSSSTKGKIYAVRGSGRLACADIIRDIYYEHRETPVPSHSAKAYLDAFLNSYENINWSDELNAFTNEECTVPGSPVLKPWRPLIAVGWTGTGVMAYPLLSAQFLTGTKNEFTGKLRGLLDEMSERINPKTGLFYDLIRPLNKSDVNGWWAGYMVSDCHCAYTNGNGIYYMLKTFELLKAINGEDNQKWLSSALTALDSAVALQRTDGCYGYTYSLEKPKTLDYDGFAGCWFTASCALAYKLTGREHYLESAEKGIGFYHEYVKNLDCWGSPMDTWKSIDQEGNLSFIRAAVLLHETTGNPKYLEMAGHGAEYEYLWRYAFKAHPEFKPLKDSKWNSCGGSVTSVSNPHIHPMGVNITAELLYIYKKTGDRYHLDRAADGINWGMASADLYPGTTGYGQLGVMTERYCPSDGLVIEKFSDTNEPSSIWFTFNGWAGASVLEGLTETLLKMGTLDKDFLNLSITDIISNIQPEVTK